LAFSGFGRMSVSSSSMRGTSRARTLIYRLALQTSTSSQALLMYLKAIGTTQAALTLSQYAL
jgi:hypothetical protein